MKVKIIPILGTILFLLEAIYRVASEDFIWSTLPIVMMAINLYSFKKIKIKPEMGNMFLSVANAFFSFIIAWYYFEHQVPAY